MCSSVLGQKAIYLRSFCIRNPYTLSCYIHPIINHFTCLPNSDELILDTNHHDFLQNTGTSLYLPASLNKSARLRNWLTWFLPMLWQVWGFWSTLKMWSGGLLRCRWRLRWCLLLRSISLDTPMLLGFLKKINVF